MGEYCKIEVYKRGRKKTRFKRKGPIIISALIFAFAIFILHLNYNINPVVRKVSEQRVLAEVTKIVNTTASNAVINGYSYSDFVELSFDSNGNIALIQTNSVLINVLSRNLALVAQEEITNLIIDGVKVPIGSFTGFTILSARGSETNIKILSFGVVSADFTSEFETAGINQTIHRLYLRVHADLKLILPGSDIVINTVTPVILAESVIIGKVPDVAFRI